MGRGSMVFFNQASMFVGPELGFDTIDAAKHHGYSGTSDYPSIAKEAFSDMSRFFPISPIF
jgi:hypothetical protein